MAGSLGFGGRRILVVAFEGWNDAGEAATTAATALRDAAAAPVISRIDDEKFFDYQFNRPTVSRDEGAASITWPAATISGPPRTGRRRARPEPVAEDTLYFLIGTEPSYHWRTFTEEVLAIARDLGVEAVVSLGAMLADVPHTRPISLFCTSENEEARQQLDLTRSSYEGPVGILSVLGGAFEEAGIPTLSLWASVPHYVHNPPSPKATLAILQKLEALLGIPLPPSELAAEAAAWEKSVDALAADDEEMSGYIAQLEKARDTVDAPEASGDAIAEEFERYLRKQGGDDPRRDGPGRA